MRRVSFTVVLASASRGRAGRVTYTQETAPLVASVPACSLGLFRISRVLLSPKRKSTPAVQRKVRQCQRTDGDVSQTIAAPAIAAPADLNSEMPSTDVANVLPPDAALQVPLSAVETSVSNPSAPSNHSALSIDPQPASQQVVQEDENPVSSPIIAPSSTSPFADLRECLYRSYRLSAVVEKLDAKGLVMAREENTTTFSFVGFDVSSSPKATTFREVADRLLLLKQDHRTFHVIVGRPDVPTDFYADIDIPQSLIVDMKRVEELIATAISSVTQLLRVRGSEKLRTPPFVYLFCNPAAHNKFSFHLHIHHPLVCFSDFSVNRAVADAINDAAGIALIDMHAYKSNGMLRLPYSQKLGKGEATQLSPYTPVTEELKQLLSPLPIEPSAEVLARCFGAREDFLRGEDFKGVTVLKKNCVSQLQRKQIIQDDADTDRAAEVVGQNHQLSSQHKYTSCVTTHKEFDHQGRPVHPFMSERLKSRRYAEAVKSIRSLPDRAAEQYDQWIRVGLALHNFGSDETHFEEWITFSLRCPVKFHREVCVRMWKRFSRHPDHMNWRRGYNYLTVTVFREFGITKSGQ